MIDLPVRSPHAPPDPDAPPSSVAFDRPGCSALPRNLRTLLSSQATRHYPRRAAFRIFEWVQVDGRNVPLRFERPGDDWIWIAGIWEAGEQGECFSMITTEPNQVLAPVHDRMPAVLSDEQISPFLEGDLNAFGPSAVALQYQEAANFLKSGKSPPPSTQGDLF